MAKEELDSLKEELQKTKLTNENVDYYFSKIIEAIKVYDNPYEKDGHKKVSSMLCIYLFFNSYLKLNYNYRCEWRFDEVEHECGGYYDPIKDEIVYNSKDLNLMLRESSLDHIFKIFHENRHKLQFLDFKKNEDQLMSIDPMSILMLKEEIGMDDLYNNNHSNFIIENDANLWAYAHILKLGLSKKMPEYKYRYDSGAKTILSNSDEMFNFGVLLYNSQTVDYYSDEYKNPKDSTLPILLEIDKKSKKKVKKETIEQYPLLKLIYHEDGKLKTYDELMKDKERLLKKYENEELNEKNITDSFNSYNKERLYRLGRDQINAIYTIIINSDPILYFENKFANNTYPISIITPLERNNPLIDDNMYRREIGKLFYKYVTFENSEKFIKCLKNSSIDEEYKKFFISKIESKNRSIASLLMNDSLGIIINPYINDDSVLKSSNILLQEKENYIKRLNDAFNNNQISELEYKNCLEKINYDYDRFIKESIEQEKYRDRNNINKSNLTGNNTRIQQNNNDVSPSHEETSDINDFYELFDTVYIERLKDEYRDENDYYLYEDDEKDEIDKKLDEYYDNVRRKNKEQGIIAYKEAKDQLWNIVKDKVKENPEYDLKRFIEYMFDNYDVFEEQEEKIDEVEPVEGPGRGFM